MDTKTPKTKVCSKCGKRKSLERYSPNRAGRFGRQSACRDCMALVSRLSNHKCRDKISARRKALGWKCYTSPEKKKEFRKRYYEKNREDAINYAKEARSKAISSLSDAYVSEVLGIPTKEAPPDLIEVKRIQLQIKRYLKNGN